MAESKSPVERVASQPRAGAATVVEPPNRSVEIPLASSPALASTVTAPPPCATLRAKPPVPSPPCAGRPSEKPPPERKSVVQGTRRNVHVDLGGRRCIKK